MSADQTIHIEAFAYREAGHAVMSCLIRKGLATNYRPFDRSLILLPSFQAIALDSPIVDWGETTDNFASLIAVSQVLLAGEAVAHMMAPGSAVEMPLNSSLVQQANHMIAAYIEECSGDQIGFVERDRHATELLKEIYKFVEEMLRTYWTSVEIVANILLQEEIISEDRVFAIVESHIPEDVRALFEQAKLWIV